MTFDEMERTMQFLLAQQAQFAAGLQQSRDMGDRRHGQVSEALMGLTAIAGGLLKADERLGQRLEAQSERFDTRLRALDERFDVWLRALDERFDARLRALDERFDAGRRALDEGFDARLRALDERIALLADAQRETETRLRSLMRVVEHHVGDGPPPSP